MIGNYRFNAGTLAIFQFRGSRETIVRFLCTTHYAFRHISLRPLGQFSLLHLTILSLPDH